ncbi:MAG: 3'-5' exonuclease [Eubacteriales bacterium]|nr:3'-5' exonuclease [Eubacteriales bacterium]
MNYIVFDLEWNQSPVGKSGECPGLPFEIVEIGAVKLNERREEIDRFHAYIRPMVYKQLHFRTKEIIHISMDTLEAAAPFPEVIEDFRLWCGENVHFCIWGSLDFLELQRNMRYHSVENFFPFPLKYYDIQKLFSLSFEDGKLRRSLEFAVDFLQIPQDGGFHSALCDAAYTAEVVKKLPSQLLDTYCSFDYFRVPSKRSEEVYIEFGSYAKFISMTFDSKRELMKDKKVTETRCYLCNRNAKKMLRWTQLGTNGRNYVSLARCEEHGYLKSKIRVRHTEAGHGYFCIKTTKLMDVDHAQELLDRVFISSP